MRLLCDPGGRGGEGRGPRPGAPIGRGAGGGGVGGRARLAAAPGRRGCGGGGGGSMVQARPSWGTRRVRPAALVSARAARPGAEPARQGREGRGQGTSWGPSTHHQIAPCLSLPPGVQARAAHARNWGCARQTLDLSGEGVLHYRFRVHAPVLADRGWEGWGLGLGGGGAGWCSPGPWFLPQGPISRVYPVPGLGAGGAEAGLELGVH